MQLSTATRPSLPQRRLTAAPAVQQPAAPQAAVAVAPKVTVKAAAKADKAEEAKPGFTDIFKQVLGIRTPEKKPAEPPKKESLLDKIIPGKPAPEKDKKNDKKNGLDSAVDQAKFLWNVTKKITAATAFVVKLVGNLIPQLNAKQELKTVGDKAAYLGKATLETSASVGVATVAGAVLGAFALPSLLGLIPVAGPFLVKALSLRWLAIGGAMLANHGWSTMLHKTYRTNLVANPTTHNLNSAAVVAASSVVGAIAGPALGLMVGAPLLPMAAIGLVSGAAVQGAIWATQKKPAEKKGAKTAAAPAEQDAAIAKQAPAAAKTLKATKAVAA